MINFEFCPDLIKFQNSTFFFQVLWRKPCPYSYFGIVRHAFKVLICLVATKFVLLSVLIALMETFCMEVWDKPLPEYAKSPLPLLKCIAQNCVGMFPNFTSQLIIKTMTKYLVSKFSSS